jgi:hypothetical protein
MEIWPVGNQLAPINAVAQCNSSGQKSPTIPINEKLIRD